MFARALTVALLSLLPMAAGADETDPDEARPAPEFTSVKPGDWLNSPPLRMRELAGKVVLLEFWTYGCGNCQRSIPWLLGLERRLAGRDFRIVGVHTPEFPHERPREQVAARAKAFGIGFPVLLDNDWAYWRAIGNHFWPTFYLVDKRGFVRATLAGETVAGDFNARTVEDFIEDLLEEPG